MEQAPFRSKVVFQGFPWSSEWSSGAEVLLMSSLPGVTPLGILSWAGNEQMARLLLDHGAARAPGSRAPKRAPEGPFWSERSLWVNYNDTRPHRNWWFMWGVAPQPPYFRLVKYYNSPRISGGMWHAIGPRGQTCFHLGRANSSYHCLPGVGRPGWLGTSNVVSCAVCILGLFLGWRSRRT